MSRPVVHFRKLKLIMVVYLCKREIVINIKSVKAYIGIFICFLTRAIHLEFVSDFSTLIFLAALKRFVAYKGKLAELVSDWATNVKGANEELRGLYNSVTSINKDQSPQNYVADEDIIWKFNPPSAPHFDGL